jgi:hypothetical protein
MAKKVTTTITYEGEEYVVRLFIDGEIVQGSSYFTKSESEAGIASGRMIIREERKTTCKRPEESPAEYLWRLID